MTTRAATEIDPIVDPLRGFRRNTSSRMSEKMLRRRLWMSGFAARQGVKESAIGAGGRDLSLGVIEGVACGVKWLLSTLDRWERRSIETAQARHYSKPVARTKPRLVDVWREKVSSTGSSPRLASRSVAKLLEHR